MVYRKKTLKKAFTVEYVKTIELNIVRTRRHMQSE